MPYIPDDISQISDNHPSYMPVPLTSFSARPSSSENCLSKTVNCTLSTRDMIVDGALQVNQADLTPIDTEQDLETWSQREVKTGKVNVGCFAAG